MKPSLPLLLSAAAISLAVSGCGGGAADPSTAPSPRITATAPATTAPPVASPTPTAKTSPSRAPSVFRGAVIGIDPGHNGMNHTRPDIINKRIRNGRGNDTETCNTTGTETDGGYPESRFTFNVATDLARMLRARGATVVMTRHSDDGVGPCVNERAKIINDAHADVAIDIHADGGPASGRGFAILEPVRSGTNNAVVPASLRYAKLLRSEFLKTGMPTSTYDGVDGFKPRTDLGGLNLTTVPQLLIECGNMRNATDAALLTSARFQQSAAEAIMRAMGDFLASRRSPAPR